MPEKNEHGDNPLAACAKNVASTFQNNAGKKNARQLLRFSILWICGATGAQ